MQVDSISSYLVSNDGNWLALSRYQSKEIADLKHKNKKLGTSVILWDLENNEKAELDFVSEMSFDTLSNYFAYSVIDTSGEKNGLYIQDLETDDKVTIHSSKDGYYSNLTWDNKAPQIAFTKASFDSSYTDSDASLHVWNVSDNELKTLITPEDVKDGWALRSNNDLQFEQSYEFGHPRLFFGLMPRDMVDLITKKRRQRR